MTVGGVSGRLGLLVLLIAPFGCRGSSEAPYPPTPDRSPSARLDIVEALRQDLTAERHPSDGGGRVRFDDPPMSAVAGQSGSWSFVFETGPEGIAEGGWVFFQAPPFWGWSMPQVVEREALGFTRVTSDVEGVSLNPATVDQQLLGIQVQDGELAPGDLVRIHYGAGPAGAHADSYAESRSCFFFAVDGDGDGIRSLLPESLCIEVTSGPPSRLVLSMPSTAKPGDSVKLSAAVLDAGGNRVTGWSGRMGLESSGGIELPAFLELRPQDEGARSAEVRVTELGVVKVRAVTSEGLVGESNPMLVTDVARRILWADLHGHSALSDGTGSPKDYFRYSRDVAALDVVALTDHDHWGMEPLALHPELFEEIRRETELFHHPGQFVTLLGYEWTSWIHGHRHVLYFSDHGEVYSSLDEDFETPSQLWQALRGQEALTFAHHSAGGPIATNWNFPPDPELEPVTEIASVHGSSEAADSPTRIYSPVAGNYVRDALDRGYELGFIGSGDSHDGHPGLAHLNAAAGGLAAILSEELTREGVLEALRSRRVYATSGPRVVLLVDLGNHPMGTTLDAELFADRGPELRRLRAIVVAPAPLERIDVIRSGKPVDRIDCDRRAHCSLDRLIEDVEAGEYLYLRAVQEDGDGAWCSPFFFR